VKQGRNTTMDVTPEQEAAIQWDFNNIVEHGKSIAMVNALESLLGRETFQALYVRCLREYAGKPLGWREFQRVAEIESGQNLNWFFESWVRSSGSVFYRFGATNCAPSEGGFDCTVQVERTGALRMPVTMAARFEDGSEQRARTERLADADELHFQSRTRLRDVAVDPDHQVVMVEAPPAVVGKIQDLPWTGSGHAALQAYQEARQVKIEDGATRRKLALLLYDGRYYEEALEMEKSVEQDATGDWLFAALVWKGHILDLLGRRTPAIAAYQEALQVPGTHTVRHDQYNLVIDRKWVEDRLKTPFERK